MALTQLTNMINPEVMADMISAQLTKKIRFAPLATIDTTLEGQPGNSITVPKFAYIGDAEDVAEGIAIGTTVLSATTDSTPVIKKAGKAVEISDEAVLSGYGDPIGEAQSQLSKSVVNKIDNDCLAQLGTAPLAYDGSAKVIDYETVVNAVDLFEEEDDEPRVLFIHSKQKTQLRKDPNFIRASDLGDKVLITGTIGEIAGCQVVVSNKITDDTLKYENYIVKSGALTIYLKRKVNIEDDRDILKKTTVIVVDEHYVAHLSDDSKVVKLTAKK